MADKGLTLGQVHIWLDDHPIHQVPAALPDELSNLFKQLRVLLLDPLVYLRFAAIKMKIGIFVQPVHSGLAGRQGFRPAFCPTPQPNWIEVCLADHVYG